MYTSPVMKRIQIYIDDSVDEALTQRARRERRSKAALIRDAVSHEYGNPPTTDPFDDWAGGIDEAPGDIDDVVYAR
jgi:predicted transcriptional regulator